MLWRLHGNNMPQNTNNNNNQNRTTTTTNCDSIMHSTLLQSSQDSPDWVIKCAIRDFCQPEFIMAAPWADIGRRFHLIIYIHTYLYMYILSIGFILLYTTGFMILSWIYYNVLLSFDCSNLRNSLI